MMKELEGSICIQSTPDSLPADVFINFLSDFLIMKVNQLIQILILIVVKEDPWGIHIIHKLLIGLVMDGTMNLKSYRLKTNLVRDSTSSVFKPISPLVFFLDGIWG